MPNQKTAAPKKKQTSRKTDGKPQDAIALLKEDHKRVKALFDQFEEAEGKPAKQQELAQKAIEELKVHSALEKEIFYPAVRPGLEAEDEELLMNEADEEHHVVDVLIEEIESMNYQGSHFEAKFIVLAENVRHHIKEEEEEMFPKCRELDLDLAALGAEMLQRKTELIAEPVPLFK